MLSEFVPPYLKTRRIWILWKIVEKDGHHTTKIPISAAPGLPWARSNHPEDWTTYDTASEYAAKSGLRMGIMLPPDHTLLFVDLDNSINDAGELSETAKDILTLMPSSYVEISQSHRGLHLVCQGTIPRNSKNTELGVELYNTRRFAALTFDCLRKADVAEESRVDELFARYATKRRPQAKIRPNVGPPSKVDQDIVTAVMEHPKYAKLWAGEWQGRFGSQSEADLSLLNFLAYLTDRNPAQMQRLFERSGLVREKWLSRPDYREMSIAAACDGCTESRSERQRRRQAEKEAWLLND